MNARQTKKLLRKVNYAVGPTGYGPIPGVGKPPAKFSRSEQRIIRESNVLEAERKLRRQAWAEAVKEVTGEEIGDE